MTPEERFQRIENALNTLSSIDMCPIAVILYYRENNHFQSDRRRGAENTISGEKGRSKRLGISAPSREHVRASSSETSESEVSAYRRNDLCSS
jgi:hypothetical protein